MIAFCFAVFPVDTGGRRMLKPSKMSQKKSGFSLERIFLVLIISLGCLGLSSAFQSTQKLSSMEDSKTPLTIRGSFTINAPIRFTLNNRQFPTHNLEIDFGNGVQRTLKDSSFTFAYTQEGQYTLKIKQGDRVLYRTSIYITAKALSGKNLLVLHEAGSVCQKK